MCYHFDSNSIIAFAAIASLVVSFFLWRATKRTAEIASETLNLAYGAKLAVEVHNLIEDPVEGTAILVKIKNGGAGYAVMTKFTTTPIVGGDALQPIVTTQKGITILGNDIAEIRLPALSLDLWVKAKRVGLSFQIKIDVNYEDMRKKRDTAHVTARYDFERSEFVEEVSL